MQTVTFWGLMQFVLVAGFSITILGGIILRLVDDKSLPMRIRKLVNGKWIWVNGFDSNLEFIHDPRDPAGQLRPDHQMLKRENHPEPGKIANREATTMF